MPEENTPQPENPENPQPVVEETPEASSVSPKSTKSNKKTVLIVVILLLILGLGSYFLLAGKFTTQKAPSQIATTISPTPTVIPIPFVDISTWKEYSNVSLGFALNYPGNWTITNGKDSVSLMTPENPDCLPPHKCGGTPSSPLVIKFADNLEKKTLDQFVSDYLKTSFPDVPSNSTNPSSSLNNLVKRLVDSGFPSVAKNIPGECGEQLVFVSLNSKVLVFDMNCVNSSEKEIDTLFYTLKLASCTEKLNFQNGKFILKDCVYKSVKGAQFSLGGRYSDIEGSSRQKVEYIMDYSISPDKKKVAFGKLTAKEVSNAFQPSGGPVPQDLGVIDLESEKITILKQNTGSSAIFSDIQAQSTEFTGKESAWSPDSKGVVLDNTDTTDGFSHIEYCLTACTLVKKHQSAGGQGAPKAYFLGNKIYYYSIDSSNKPILESIDWTL